MGTHTQRSRADLHKMFLTLALIINASIQFTNCKSLNTSTHTILTKTENSDLQTAILESLTDQPKIEEEDSEHFLNIKSTNATERRAEIGLPVMKNTYLISAQIGGGAGVLLLLIVICLAIWNTLKPERDVMGGYGQDRVSSISDNTRIKISSIYMYDDTVSQSTLSSHVRINSISEESVDS